MQQYQVALRITKQLDLAKCIEEAIREEFKTSHLSQNLVNTIKIEQYNGVVTIDIPAMKYNMKKFKETGVIKYYYRGSYAEQLNQRGEHKGYVERCIEKGIEKWMAQKGVSCRVSYDD